MLSFPDHHYLRSDSSRLPVNALTMIINFLDPAGPMGMFSGVEGRCALGPSNNLYPRNTRVFNCPSVRVRKMKNIKSIAASLVLGFSTVTFTATAALSAPITIPVGLNPGDQYRLAFITGRTETRDALSTDIADYNAFVDGVAESVAELASLNQDWKAIASTETVNARDNTNTLPSIAGGSLGVRIFGLNGIVLAANYDDLWDGSIGASGIRVDQNGTSLNGNSRTWTGTAADGTACRTVAPTFCAPGAGPLGFTLNAFAPGIGSFGTTDQRWVVRTRAGAGNFLPFYAISGVLTVPGAISEPGALGVLTLGLVGLGFARLRKRLN